MLLWPVGLSGACRYSSSNFVASSESPEHHAGCSRMYSSVTSAMAGYALHFPCFTPNASQRFPENSLGRLIANASVRRSRKWPRNLYSSSGFPVLEPSGIQIFLVGFCRSVNPLNARLLSMCLMPILGRFGCRTLLPLFIHDRTTSRERIHLQSVSARSWNRTRSVINQTED